MSKTRTPSTTPRRALVPMATVADELGVSVRTVRRWVAEGLVAGYRIGPRAIRVDPDEVAKAMSHRIPNARDAK